MNKKYRFYPNLIVSKIDKDKEIQPMVYTIPEVSNILGITMSQTYRLLDAEKFPIIRAVRKKLIPIKPFHAWVQANYPEVVLPKYIELPRILKEEKYSYSVPEVRAMLGMKKTSSYEMIKIGTFDTFELNEHIRITKESFDAWFHAKDHLYIMEGESYNG